MAEQTAAQPAPSPAPQTPAAPAPRQIGTTPEQAADKIAAFLAAEEGGDAPQDAPQGAPEGQEPAPPREEGADVPEDAPAGESAPDADAQAADGEDADVAQVSSLSDLAEYLGVDAAELYGLTIPVNDADGVRQEITLGEWKDGYQSSEKAQRQAKELADAREAFDAERTQAMAQIQRQGAETAALIDSLEKSLTAEFEGYNWAELRASDPSEWAAKRTEFGERQAQIQDARNRALAQLEAAQREQQEAFQREAQAYVAREREALLTAIPEWRDDRVAESEMAGLRNYLSQQGFTSTEIGNAADHRLIVMAKKAQAFDEQQAKVAVDKKRVLRIGKKVLKPGAKQTRDEQQHDALSGLRAKARKSGSVDDVAALIAASGLGGKS